MKRLSTAAVVVATGLIALSPTAALAYGAPPPSVSVSDGVVAPGEAVIFSGTGFAPSSEVLIAIVENSATAAGIVTSASTLAEPEVLGVVVTDDQGAFSVPVEITEPGSYTLVASGLDREGNERTLTSNVVVDGQPVSDGGSGSAGGGTGSNGSTGGTRTGGATMSAGSSRTVSSGTTQTASATGSSGELARTGVDGLGLQVGAAAAFVVVGGAAVGAAAVRRRRAGA